MKKEYKLIVTTLAASLAFVGASAFMSSEALAGEWKQNSVGWWYQNTNGSYKANEWFQDSDGSWYYFDYAGYADLDEWDEIDGKWYYFYNSGRMASDQWIGNYYVGSDGAMLTNTVTPSGYSVGPDGAITAAATTTPTTTSSTGVVSQPTTQTYSGNITLETAKTIAFTNAGVTAAQATIIKSYVDYDDGRQVYDIEFYAGNYKYEYEITVTGGYIVGYDREYVRYAATTTPAATTPATTPATTGGYGYSTTASVSDATARQTALSRVPGATTSNIYEWKLDYDDGRLEYEGKIIYNNLEYEFSISATTGNITEWSVESIWD